MQEHVYKEEVQTKPSAFDSLTKTMLSLTDKIFRKKNKQHKPRSKGISRVFLVLILTILVLLVVRGTYNKFIVSVPGSFVQENLGPGDNENSSRYANDSTVVSLGEKIEALETRLTEIDLKNAELREPNLDFDIDFKD